MSFMESILLVRALRHFICVPTTYAIKRSQLYSSGLLTPVYGGRQEEKWARRYRQFWFREMFVVATCSRSIKVNGQATLLIDTAEPR